MRAQQLNTVSLEEIGQFPRRSDIETTSRDLASGKRARFGLFQNFCPPPLIAEGTDPNFPAQLPQILGVVQDLLFGTTDEVSGDQMEDARLMFGHYVTTGQSEPMHGGECPTPPRCGPRASKLGKTAMPIPLSSPRYCVAPSRACRGANGKVPPRSVCTSCRHCARSSCRRRSSWRCGLTATSSY